MSCFCGRKATLPLGFSSPGRLLSPLKSPALHREQQGGAYIRGRVGGVQKQTNFCFSIETKAVSGHTLRGRQHPHKPRQAPAVPPPCPCASAGMCFPGFPRWLQLCYCNSAAVVHAIGIHLSYSRNWNPSKRIHWPFN